MNLFGVSKKINGIEVYSNLQDKRNELIPQFRIGYSVCTADIKKNFQKRLNKLDI